jgi:tRNA-dihydrouridine synthase C
LSVLTKKSCILYKILPEQRFIKLEKALCRGYILQNTKFFLSMTQTKQNFIQEVWPGPMEGVMKTPFIQTVSKLKLVSRWMTPFYRVTTGVPREKQIVTFLEPFLATGLPVSGQIMGTDRELLCKTALLMLKCGCIDVNLNCGCPSARVVSGNAGGGALKDLNKLADILKALRDTIAPGYFSVKCRIGYQTPESARIIPLITENGSPDRLFVHARSVKELYNPVPDMEHRFGEILQITRAERENGMKLILNGDISTVKQAEKLAPCGVMCARSWMRDPELLRRIEFHENKDSETSRKEFFDTFCQLNRSRGAALEVARMLWGADSAQFRSLL